MPPNAESPDPPDPQFALLRHELSPEQQRRLQRQSHWDLLLQREDRLLAWALEGNPLLVPGRHRAHPLPDHRLVYLDFEGPLSADRGSVTRWDRGPLEWLESPAGHWMAQIEGSRANGQLSLVPSQRGFWWLSFAPAN